MTPAHGFRKTEEPFLLQNELNDPNTQRSEDIDCAMAPSTRYMVGIYRLEKEMIKPGPTLPRFNSMLSTSPTVGVICALAGSQHHDPGCTGAYFSQTFCYAGIAITGTNPAGYAILILLLQKTHSKLVGTTIQPANG